MKLTARKARNAILRGDVFEYGLEVSGDLDLFGCTALTSLPSKMKVSGNLDLTGCAALTALPPELMVGGSLYLTGCRALTSLPPGLKVGGEIIGFRGVYT